MNYEFQPKDPLAEAVMGSVFAGIAATLVNLAFDYFFRLSVHFYASEIINVASIIFATMLLFTIAGLLYFALDSISKNGYLIYMLIFALLTLVCLMGLLQISSSAHTEEFIKFRNLLSGIVGITGLLITFFVPYLEKHNAVYY